MGKNRNEVETYQRNRGFSYRADFQGGRRVIFEAWGNPGISEDATGDKDKSTGWQIVKHFYTSNRLVKSLWAEKTLDNGNKKATDEFLFAWSLRDSTITYS